MEKVHIALVGAQTVPVYIGIKDDTQAQKVILICSEQSREEARRLVRQFPLPFEVKVTSPVDLVKISKLSEHLKSENEGCEITINLSSGTKIWALSIYQTFVNTPNTRFLYVDQTNNIIDFKTGKSHKGEIRPFTRLELYGAKLSSSKKLENYTETDFNVVDKIMHIRKTNKPDFALLTSAEKCDDLENIPMTTLGSSLHFSHLEQKADIVLYDYNGTWCIRESLESEHLSDILFNTAWFELKVAKDIKENKNVKNVWLNCTFPYTKGNPKNEIDIIVELPDRLLFVECKTMIHDITDIDKFAMAMKNYSGISTNGLFVTLDKPGKYNKNRKRNLEDAKEKCKDNNIQFFNYALWKENPNNEPNLIDIIDGLLDTQNKR